jgi:hypothetical protein
MSHHVLLLAGMAGGRIRGFVLAGGVAAADYPSPQKGSGWLNEPASREGAARRRSCERVDTAAVSERSS